LILESRLETWIEISRLPGDVFTFGVDLRGCAAVGGPPTG
jgi:hypothetical protein